MYANEWSADEVQKLKELYPLLRVKELVSHFPKRNRYTIATKAYNLKLPSAKLWQQEKNKLLRKHFSSMEQRELGKLFPTRSWAAIVAQGERLGLSRNRHAPKKLVNEHYFDTLTANSSYLLGFVVSDGCITKGIYKGYSDALKFGVQLKDIDILEKIKRELGSEHKISIVKNAAHLTITSQILVDKLKTYSVTYRKSLKEEVPDIPSLYIKDFIRGIIDGDGGISFSDKRYPKIHVCGSIKIISFIQKHLYHQLGAYSVIGKRKYSTAVQAYLCSIAYHANTAKKIITYLYKNAALYLDRKYALALRSDKVIMRNRRNFKNYKDLL